MTLPLARFAVLYILLALAVSNSLFSQPTSQKPTLQIQVTQHEQRLAEARKHKDATAEAEELFNLGTLYAQTGNEQGASDSYVAALTLARSIKSDKLEIIVLRNLESFYQDRNEPGLVLDYCGQELVLRRRLRDEKEESSVLERMGLIQSDTGDQQGALNLYADALKIRQRLDDAIGEGTTLNDIGLANDRLGKRQLAVQYYNDSLSFRRKMKDLRGETITLYNLANTYIAVGKREQALDLYERVVQIRREQNDHGGEINAINGLVGTYILLGEDKKALSLFNDLISQLHTESDASHEARSYGNLGSAYWYAGKFQDGIDSCNTALTLFQQAGDKVREAGALRMLAVIYGSLGENKLAVEYSERALLIQRERKDGRAQAATLSNESTYLSHMGQEQRALQAAQTALVYWRRVGNRGGEAGTLHTIGWIYRDANQNQQAVNYFKLALERSQNLENQLYSLRGLGEAYDALGQSDKVLAPEVAALSTAQIIGNPDWEGEAYSSLMMYWRGQKLPELAILCGIDAINAFQKVRQNISEQNSEAQASLSKAKSPTYRTLAELLVQTDRLGEAEVVLDLLKETELQETVRGANDAGGTTGKQVELDIAETRGQKGLTSSEKTAITLTTLSAEYDSLVSKRIRTPDEDARLESLSGEIEKSNRDLSSFFKNVLYPELAAGRTNKDANARLGDEKENVSQLQSGLATLGSSVIGVRLLLGQTHSYEIVVTAHARKRIELNVDPEVLRTKVLTVRRDLRLPSSAPNTGLEELYNLLVKPIEGELPKGSSRSDAGLSAPTILWSLDGVLRYIPMGALYDGKRYMLERFNNVLFTPESYRHIDITSTLKANQLQMLAMGISKSYGGLPALPEVQSELESVVHDPTVPSSHGPMDGRLLPNEQFTVAAFKTELGTGKTFPVVHIASHFIVEGGAGKEPYLMLGSPKEEEGRGYPLKLSEIQDSTISFHGTQLLTLSACSTASGATDENGMEMDGLGMIAQQKDAQAVLATLWSVRDESTSRLMDTFYQQWVKHPTDGKAEALRQAQLSLLQRKGERSQKTGTETDFSHPFYWAPYVLMGNFR